MPGINDVRAAAERIAPFVSPTPLLRSAWLSDLTGGDVWLKLEFVQTTGSFKLRGAINALAVLKARDATARVVTASAGNHGIAVAWAAARLGLQARVYLPATAPAAKRQALAHLGAELLDARSYDDAEGQARADARSGLTYISPYNHPDVIAGAGTVALEMLTDHPDLDVLIAPLGGGGLLSGAAIVARSSIAASGSSRGPQALLIVGAEADASPVFTSALRAGRPVTVHVHPTLADGLAGNMEPTSRTFEIVRDLVDRVVLVKESSIEDAMRGLIAYERLIVEGAAATAVGAFLQGGLDLAGRRIGVILSGRNVDVDVIRRILGGAVDGAPGL